MKRRPLLKPGSSKGLLPRNNAAKMRRIQTGYSSNWKEIAAAVRKRDNFKCQKTRNGKICGRHAYEVHHLIPAERGGRPVMSNLITICHECHERAPGHDHMRKH